MRNGAISAQGEKSSPPFSEVITNSWRPVHLLPRLRGKTSGSEICRWSQAPRWARWGQGEGYDLTWQLTGVAVLVSCVSFYLYFVFNAFYLFFSFCSLSFGLSGSIYRFY